MTTIEVENANRLSDSLAEQFCGDASACGDCATQARRALKFLGLPDQSHLLVTIGGRVVADQYLAELVAVDPFSYETMRAINHWEDRP